MARLSGNTTLTEGQLVKLQEMKSIVTLVLISHERKYILTSLSSDLTTATPILDGFNGEIIAYDVSASPSFHQTFKMLNQLDQYGSLNGMILHSDQGWQYQNAAYQQFLKERGIVQSMSRKGNSLDNGLMENFFSVLKREMFYGYEDQYKNTDELIQAIHQYIQYYNNDRIKVKLKGLSPVQYRTQSQAA